MKDFFFSSSLHALIIEELVELVQWALWDQRKFFLGFLELLEGVLPFLCVRIAAASFLERRLEGIFFFFSLHFSYSRKSGIVCGDSVQ